MVNLNQPKMEWVKAKIELPVKEKLYLVCIPTLDSENPIIQLAWYNISSKNWQMLPTALIDSITYWMDIKLPSDINSVE